LNRTQENGILTYKVEEFVCPLVVDVGQLVGRDLEGEDHGGEASGSACGVQLQEEEEGVTIRMNIMKVSYI